MMSFTFKLVYTDITKTITVTERHTLLDLFNEASAAFERYIDYHKYYLDFVLIGQPEKELAREINTSPESSEVQQYLETPLNELFRNNWRNIGFYIRPIDRRLERFVRNNTYRETDNHYWFYNSRRN